MKTKTAKIAALLLLYACLHLAEACKKEVICECPSVLPYFDYKALSVSANGPIIIDNLELVVSPDSIEYLACGRKREHFSIISEAWACSCLWNGHDGPKNALVSLNIYADRDYNDALPAGASLNSLFYRDGGDVLVPLDPNSGFGDFWAVGEGQANLRPLRLYAIERPQFFSVPYRFSVEIVKSTGDTLRVQTGEVFFP